MRRWKEGTQFHPPRSAWLVNGDDFLYATTTTETRHVKQRRQRPMIAAKTIIDAPYWFRPTMVKHHGHIQHHGQSNITANPTWSVHHAERVLVTLTTWPKYGKDSTVEEAAKQPQRKLSECIIICFLSRLEVSHITLLWTGVTSQRGVLFFCFVCVCVCLSHTESAKKT